MIRRTCSGVALYSRLRIMVLIATDLPEPVVPAISACGIFARSATTGSPAISLPSDKVSTDLDLSKASERRISLR